MDFLSLFDEESEENSEASTSTTSKSSKKPFPPFVPCFHDKDWFLQSERCLLEGETALYSGYRLFEDKKYEEALELFENFYSHDEHNRFNQITLLNCIIDCLQKLPIHRLDENSSIGYLQKLEELIVDYGDQLQYLIAKIGLVARFESHVYDDQFVDAVILLCTMSELADNWMMFRKKTISRKSQNFELAYHVRALMSFEQQLHHGKGFAVETIRNKMAWLNRTIDNMGASSNEIAIARCEMTWHSVNHKDADVGEELRVHDCRQKSRFLDAEQQREAVQAFRQRFKWMFQ